MASIGRNIQILALSASVRSQCMSCRQFIQGHNISVLYPSSSLSRGNPTTALLSLTSLTAPSTSHVALHSYRPSNLIQMSLRKNLASTLLWYSTNFSSVGLMVSFSSSLFFFGPCVHCGGEVGLAKSVFRGEDSNGTVDCGD